jgi:hypothetical protein
MTRGTTHFNPSKFGNIQNPWGHCNYCGSPFHWADNCDVSKLEDRIQDMELQMKQQGWTNYVEDYTCDDNHTVAAVDLHHPEVTTYPARVVLRFRCQHPCYWKQSTVIGS